MPISARPLATTFTKKIKIIKNSLYARKLIEGEFRKASRRLGAAHLEYLKETELLEDLPEDL